VGFVGKTRAKNEILMGNMPSVVIKEDSRELIKKKELFNF